MDKKLSKADFELDVMSNIQKWAELQILLKEEITLHEISKIIKK
jgi:hypothetical protein